MLPLLVVVIDYQFTNAIGCVLTRARARLRVEPRRIVLYTC